MINLNLALSFYNPLTYSWDALHWDLPHSFFEAGQTGVDLPDLTLFFLNQLLNNLSNHNELK